jgi:hypothetical protein
VPPPDFTIAFLGDQSVGADAKAVLQLILAEGTDAVIHAGDLGYNRSPQAWEDQIDTILGPDFPYFASAGNHDKDDFPISAEATTYQSLLQARMGRLGLTWDGDLGIQSALIYEGILIVLTAPDDFGAGDGFHDLYIHDRLAESNAMWRISAWHRNMRLMQVGGKDDDTGWGVYEESRRGGAIIATAHEHSYSRTHLLSSIQSQTIASTANTLRLSLDDQQTLQQDEGRSFAFVSGLGGKGIRDQELDGPWWASIYTSTQNADYGALFGIFHYDGNPRLAYFYFKDIGGNIEDTFFVESPPGLGPACTDGVDNDADGLTDFPDDPGCEEALDGSERDSSLLCDDGIDNDGDLRIDFDPVTFASPGDENNDPAGQGDPVCKSPTFAREHSQCQDGFHNDGDGKMDYDGGRSIYGTAQTQVDNQCVGAPSKNREKATRCGLGFEPVLMLAPLGWLSGRRRRRLA